VAAPLGGSAADCAEEVKGTIPVNAPNTINPSEKTPAPKGAGFHLASLSYFIVARKSAKWAP
jgi:hypothetical protein